MIQMFTNTVQCFTVQCSQALFNRATVHLHTIFTDMQDKPEI